MALFPTNYGLFSFDVTLFFTYMFSDIFLINYYLFGAAYIGKPCNALLERITLAKVSMDEYVFTSKNIYH